MDPLATSALEQAAPALLAAVRGSQSGDGHWLAVSRYLSRMKGRPTPFSLLAGYSVGTVHTKEVTAIELAPRTEYLRVVRLENGLVGRLLEGTPTERWRARANLIVHADVVRVVRLDPEGKQVSTDIVRSPTLDRVLAAARSDLTTSEIARIAAAGGEPGPEEHAFVSTLCEHQLLVRTETPAVLSDDETLPLKYTRPEAHRAAHALRSSVVSSTATTSHQDVLENEAGKLGARDLIVDLLKPTRRANLGSDVTRAAIDVVNVMQRITEGSDDLRIERFARQFRARWGDRHVPLLEALDPNRGLRFPRTKAPHTMSSADLVSWRVRLFEQACRRDARHVQIDRNELPPNPLWPLPESFALCFGLALEPEIAIYNPLVIGAPGTQFFARATSLDSGLRDATRAFLAAVADESEADIADLAYLPAGSYGAVTQFPLLQPFELTLDARSAYPDQSIDANDLVVSIAADGKPVLHRLSTQRQLKIRSTGALDPDRLESSDCIRFLSMLAGYGASAVFHWGELSQASFLPRLQLGHHVLKGAQWNVGPGRTSTLKATSRHARLDAAQLLRQELRLPRHVRFHEVEDRELAVDFEDPWSIEAWLSMKLPSTLQLSEAPAFERSAVSGPEGPYHHEIILPMREPRAARREAPLPVHIADSATRFDRIAPFADCLSLSFHGDVQSLVEVLLDLHDNVVEPAERSAHYTRWHYTTRRETVSRIDLHVFGDPGDLWSPGHLRALHQFFAPHIEHRVIASVSIETYERQSHIAGSSALAVAVEGVHWRSSQLALEVHRDSFGADVHGLLLPLVESLGVVAHAADLEARPLLRLIGTIGASLTSEAERVEVRRNAGSYYRQHQRAFEAQQVVDPRFDPHLARLREAFAIVRDLSGDEQLEPLLTHILVAHAKRVADPVAGERRDLVSMAFILFEKVLQFDNAVRAPARNQH